MIQIFTLYLQYINGSGLWMLQVSEKTRIESEDFKYTNDGARKHSSTIYFPSPTKLKKRKGNVITSCMVYSDDAQCLSNRTPEFTFHWLCTSTHKAVTQTILYLVLWSKNIEWITVLREDIFIRHQALLDGHCKSCITQTLHKQPERRKSSLRQLWQV